MKIPNHTLRRVRMIGMLWLSLPMVCMAHVVSVGFDDFYPKTSYTIALHTTIGLCHDLAALKSTTVSPDMQALLVDAVLGKATRLVASVKNIVADSAHNSIVTDDGSYLLALIMHLEQALNNHALCIESYPLIHQTKEQLMEYCLHDIV